MNRFLFFVLLCPLLARSHPGVGIVADSKGNIFYTDLQQVWKISGGNRSVLIPNVHTHELYMAPNDELYGEGTHYDSRTEKFYHYLWVYRRGHFDTVMGMREDFRQHDFSLARDPRGNEYYTKQFLRTPDTSHLFIKPRGGAERILARGNFKGVSWIHPQVDGTVLYVRNNTIYRVYTDGRIMEVKKGIGSAQPSFSFSGNSVTIWGLWQDSAENVYAAVFSDQAVRKIDKAGNMTDVYRSTGKWAPLHGVFDMHGVLWVLEGSDKNEVQVSRAGSNEPISTATPAAPPTPYWLLGAGLVGIVAILAALRRSRLVRRAEQTP